MKISLKIVAYKDRPGAGDGQAITDDLAVGIDFHHDRTLENPLPIVSERRPEGRPSRRGEFLYAV
jgi:hypothetical protein